ncbi:hypothetical protein DPMN_067715 [Dreissena polymorpha]|uniref:Uncharacterized protein n=1 Tax=Dreissena polymorpha TaxID=45954 RepID=A0A9D3YW98_DREPO|nr:hypothetical protein DPMN_067715 [Dreissena polymorpha]
MRKTKRVQPRNTVCRYLDADANHMGNTWIKLKRLAQNRRNALMKIVGGPDGTTDVDEKIYIREY